MADGTEAASRASLRFFASSAMRATMGSAGLETAGGGETGETRAAREAPPEEGAGAGGAGRSETGTGEPPDAMRSWTGRSAPSDSYSRAVFAEPCVEPGARGAR